MQLIGIGGLPGSGKSTLAERLGLPTVAPDHHREAIEWEHPTMEPANRARLIWALCLRDARRLMLARTPVILFDAPHLSEHLARRPVQLALEHGYSTALVLLSTAPDECLKRQRRRGRTLEPDMWARYVRDWTARTVDDGWCGWEQVIETSDDLAERSVDLLVRLRSYRC